MSMTLKETFKIKEKTDFCLIDIVYKPVFNKEGPILCYFTDSSHLPFRSYIRRNVKIEQKKFHQTVRQCH